MSTPSVTILKNLVLNWETDQMEEETIATFYRHYDGYPSCHAVDIANSLIVASRTKPEYIDFSGAKEMKTGISCLRAEPLNVWHGLTDIAGIAKSSVGHPGGCPFSLAFWEPPCGRREGAGALRERGLGGGFPTLPTACGSG